MKDTNLVSQPKTKASVVIIAGGEGGDELSVSQGVAHRSLIEVAGISTISRIIDALSSAKGVADIVVVGAPEVLPVLPQEIKTIKATETPAQNIALGLGAVEEEWVIISTADIPWLTAGGVEAFLSAAIATGADIVYPIVSRRCCEERFPGGKRTYATLREGTYTGGNLVLAKKEFLQSQIPLIHRLFENRKNPIALARLLGFGFVLKLLLKRLSIAAVEARAHLLTGGRVAALPIDRAELAFDIDKIEDLNVARETEEPKA